MTVAPASFDLASRMKLTVACDPFDSVRALMDGTLQAPELELDFVTDMTNPERHMRMVRDLAFDVCELNISTFLIAHDQSVPVTAIPVFLFRKFRHGNIFVRADSGIAHPNDLKGRRVGLPNLQPAANVWIKGILRDEFGLGYQDFIHVVQEDEEIAFDPPSGLRVERALAGAKVFDMLERGDLPAVISPLVPDAIAEPQSGVRRLFPDYLARERAYFVRTGLFPIMHVTVVRNDLLRRHPWLGARLCGLFEAAKHMAYRHVANTRLVPLAWFGAHWEDECNLFGGDAWPNGLTALNRRNVQTAIDYSFDQGLMRRKPAIEDLFVDVADFGEPALGSTTSIK